MGAARLLCVMGSGETSPTMVGVHRELLRRCGDGPIVVLDTPVGFQLNADALAARAVEYFRISLSRRAEVATLRRADDPPVKVEQALARLRAAAYVFAGPGSPTYALEQWTRTVVPDILRDKLRHGGCVTFASAAALTLGAHTIPVYEIYKVGSPVHWRQGLDLMSELGLTDVAVVPHYDNREGGDHDTRYCYMGEPRLLELESQLPEGGFILGVDEHTAAVFDLDAATVEVSGKGALVVRVAGAEARLPAGERAPVAELRGLASTTPAAAPPGPPPGAPEEEHSPFWPEVGRLEETFDKALSAGDLESATNAALALDDHLWRWSTETFGTDELLRGRATLRRMVTELGRLAARLPASRAEVIAPFVEALLEVREQMRTARDFGRADRLRDLLAAHGVTVADTPEGPRWEASEQDPARGESRA